MHFSKYFKTIQSHLENRAKIKASLRWKKRNTIKSLEAWCFSAPSQLAEILLKLLFFFYFKNLGAYKQEKTSLCKTEETPPWVNSKNPCYWYVLIKNEHQPLNRTLLYLCCTSENTIAVQGHLAENKKMVCSPSKQPQREITGNVKSLSQFLGQFSIAKTAVRF